MPTSRIGPDSDVGYAAEFHTPSSSYLLQFCFAVSSAFQRGRSGWSVNAAGYRTAVPVRSHLQSHRLAHIVQGRLEPHPSVEPAGGAVHRLHGGRGHGEERLRTVPQIRQGTPRRGSGDNQSRQGLSRRGQGDGIARRGQTVGPGRQNSLQGSIHRRGPHSDDRQRHDRAGQCGGRSAAQ